MPSYPYYCEICIADFEVLKSMAEATRAEPCPHCGAEVRHQNHAAKQVGGFISTESNWSEGKRIVQLHPNHPDAMVTSRRHMEQAYVRNGISMDTGHFVSETAQIRGTLPKALRTGQEAGVLGGIKEEN